MILIAHHSYEQFKSTEHITSMAIAFTINFIPTGTMTSLLQFEMVSCKTFHCVKIHSYRMDEIGVQQEKCFIYTMYRAWALTNNETFDYKMLLWEYSSLSLLQTL